MDQTVFEEDCLRVKMSKVQTLRAFVHQRLTAAAEEIFEMFDRTMAEYEQELCGRNTPRLLNAAFNPEVRLHRADVQQLLVSEEEVPPEQQEWSFSLDQEEPPQLLHGKEDEEELWNSHEEDMEEADISCTPAPVSAEDEEEPQSSQLHQHSQSEGSRDAECVQTDADEEQLDTQEKTSLSSDPESEDREKIREPQSGLNSPQKSREPSPESSRSTNREMKKTEKQQRAAAAASSSDDDEDSDVEKNFALLTERGRREEAEQLQEGEDEEESSDDEDAESDGQNEDEEGSDGGEEESDGDEEEEEVEGGDSEGSDDDDDEEEDDDGDGDKDEDNDDEDEDEEDPEEAGGSSDLQTRDDIKKELSNMSFEDVLKLTSKVGTKVYQQVAYGSSRRSERHKKKRLNKNRPTEVSAKRPAPFLRQVVSVRKPTWRDPRFDDLSGEYKPEIFDKTYKFISDIKHREKEIVQKQLKKTKKNEQKKEKLQFLLKRMENQERAKMSREQQRERELQFKRQQRERANQGARPFFLKNSEKKKLQLAEKYEELKKSGKLENFLSKKRKRNAVKDRRKLPKQLQKKKAA